MKIHAVGLACAMLGPTAFGLRGQTTVDLSRQARNVDFSTAAATRPVKTGTDMPGVCSPGELYFKTDAPAGQNVYGCVATSTWALMTNSVSSGGGASMAAQLEDFKVERTSNTVLTVNSRCTATAPCLYRVGNAVFASTGPSQITLTSGAGTVYIYLSETGKVTAGYGTGLTLSCSGGCMTQPNVTGFPEGSIPLFTWVASGGGQWDAAGVDKRAVYSNTVVTTGVGLVKAANPISGIVSVAVDTTAIGVKAPVPASATSTCAPSQWAADSTYLYLCVAPNTWRRTALSSW